LKDESLIAGVVLYLQGFTSVKEKIEDIERRKKLKEFTEQVGIKGDWIIKG
jgi:hypothetical protein